MFALREKGEGVESSENVKIVEKLEENVKMGEVGKKIEENNIFFQLYLILDCKKGQIMYNPGR